jgi:Tfp pilus assembly protein PilX
MQTWLANHWSVRSARQNQGQVGLIVLLVMVVILALGLSLATRTSQQAEIAIQQEDSTRVFNAAEAGVEAALADIFQGEAAGDISGISEDLASLDLTGSNADINYNITKSNTLETHLKQGTSTELVLPAAGSISFYWAIESSCEETASLLLSVYNDDGSDITARHYAVGDCSGVSTRGDNFIANDPGPIPYQYAYTLFTGSDDKFVRVKPVYNDTDIKIVGSPAVSQFTINSQAQNTLAGEETRTFEVKRTLSTAPAFMEYALVSGSSIIKN